MSEAIKQEKLKALNEGEDHQFSSNSQPKCPHCGTEFNIEDHKAWEVYGEDGLETEVKCTSCGLAFTITTDVSYSFSTNEQPEDEE